MSRFAATVKASSFTVVSSAEAIELRSENSCTTAWPAATFTTCDSSGKPV